MKKILFAFLFVLTLIPAAFSAPGSFTACAATGTHPNLTPACQQPTDTRVIKGTVVEKGTNYQTKIPRVSVKFVPAGKNAADVSPTTVANSAFAIFIPKDQTGGSIVFSADGYKTLTLSLSYFPENLGKYVEMEKQTSATRTGGGSSGTAKAGTGTDGDVKNFSAKLIYDAHNKEYQTDEQVYNHCEYRHLIRRFWTIMLSHYIHA